MGELHDLSRPLHEQKPTTRFSDRVKDYVQFRPSYPRQVFEAMTRGLPEELVAADVGAGTGISTHLLAPFCSKLYAIEPNRDMANAAIETLHTQWIIAPAESTTLANSSVHLVLAAQAFHWFDQKRVLPEFHRILKPGGRLALLWNIRDPSDAVAAAYTNVIREHGNEHPAEMRDFDPTHITVTGLFSKCGDMTFGNSQSLNEAGLLGRAFSASYVPKEGPRAQAIAEQLRQVFARNKKADGMVRMGYVTRLFLFDWH